jgi:hypothetical protein
MIDYSHSAMAELIARFVDGTGRLGSAFNLPFKMDRESVEGQALFKEMQLLGEELRARKPIAEIRPLFEHPNSDVRYWAAIQFAPIDPEWAHAVYGAVREHLTTGEVITLVQKAKKKWPKRPALSDMSIAELVHRFEDSSIQLYATSEFMSDDNGLPETKTYNRVMDEIGDAANELRARKALNALLPLLEHPNFVTRRVTAATCLPIASAQAIPVLEAIADGKFGRERISAWWTLNQWRKTQGGAPQG